MYNDDFDLDNDYVPVPVLNTGNYFVNITNVSFIKDDETEEYKGIQFQLVTEGNEGVKSDGETPADGSTLFFRVWLPMTKDKAEIGTNGLPKWQNKLNMMKRTFDNMMLMERTVGSIMGAIENQEWIGRSFQARIELKPADQYNSDLWNEVRFLKDVT